jgi:thiamine biosynthesis lipoprotein
VSFSDADVLPPGSISVEERRGGLFAVSFSAMACPCEVLFYAKDRAEAEQAGELAALEAWRVERKYSRYRDDSVVAGIHLRRGQASVLDRP